MKKIFTILALSLVSVIFTSCREDGMEAEMENTIPQARREINKVTDSIVSDTIKTNSTANKIEGDPDKDPPRDRTRW
ncbi:hypothetical protein D3C87_1024180 [compost metagenome]